MAYYYCPNDIITSCGRDVMDRKFIEGIAIGVICTLLLICLIAIVLAITRALIYCCYNICRYIDKKFYHKKANKFY
jgi:hypothetical protein